MITVSVILLRPGPNGGSFLDYAFEDSERRFPTKAYRNFICAALRSSKGVVFAHLGGDIRDLNERPSITMSFPSLIEGRPLIAQQDVKVEFRFVMVQRVFEMTFTINAKDLTDGSQAGLYLPTMITELKQSAAQSSASNQ